MTATRCQGHSDGRCLDTGAPTELEQLWNRMLFEAEGLVQFAALPLPAARHGELAAQLDRYDRAFAATSMHLRAQRPPLAEPALPPPSLPPAAPSPSVSPSPAAPAP